VPDTAPQGGDNKTPQQDDAVAEQPAQAAPEAPNMGSVNLREAAERLLAAWEETPPANADKDPIAQAMAMLRSALSRRGARATGAPRKPREGTKQEVVLAIRRHWPRVDILLRADSHYCAPEVLDFCRAARVEFIFGVAPTKTLRRHVEALEVSTRQRQAAARSDDKLRRYKEFHDGAASWNRVERIIARIEAGPQGVDTRYIVTSLKSGSARSLYEGIYCRRGQAENHIKAWKRHLAADRTSCTRAAANQFRLMLHTGAYWLLWSLRSLMPKRSSWYVAQFDTLRLRLVKIATQVVSRKSRILLHMPSACPDRSVLRMALERLPRLTC
jgi:hypothetical protein